MKRITFNLVALAFIFSLLVAGCKKDDKKEDDKVQENGLTEDINKLIPDSIFRAMVDLGMPIHRGGTPPMLAGSFIATPFILKATNVPNDYTIGYQFGDFNVKFYEQDNEKLTVKLDYSSAGETGSGVGGLIVGSNNKFSIFAEVSTTRLGYTASTVWLISGEKKDDGIHDFHAALFMINNNGNSVAFIKNGQGRVFYDADSISQKVAKSWQTDPEILQSIDPSSSIK